MKNTLLATILATSFISFTAIAAPVAGSETVGVSVQEAHITAMGWSAEKQILHKAVYNDSKKKIGVIEDIIVSPENSVSYAVVGVGGFLGMDRHDVLVPFNHFQAKGNQYLLPGASVAMLKSLPAFKYGT
ncbi:MAG: PRC-barrel domain-containing protein [Sulfuriferula sp.]